MSQFPQPQQKFAAACDSGWGNWLICITVNKKYIKEKQTLYNLVNKKKGLVYQFLVM